MIEHRQIRIEKLSGLNILHEGQYGELILKRARLKHARQQGYLLKGSWRREQRFPYREDYIRLVKQAGGRFLPAQKWWFIPLRHDNGELQAVQALLNLALKASPPRKKGCRGLWQRGHPHLHVTPFGNIRVRFAPFASFRIGRWL